MPKNQKKKKKLPTATRTLKAACKFLLFVAEVCTRTEFPYLWKSYGFVVHWKQRAVHSPIISNFL